MHNGGQVGIAVWRFIHEPNFVMPCPFLSNVAFAALCTAYFVFIVDSVCGGTNMSFFLDNFLTHIMHFFINHFKLCCNLFSCI